MVSLFPLNNTFGETVAQAPILPGCVVGYMKAWLLKLLPHSILP